MTEKELQFAKHIGEQMSGKILCPGDCNLPNDLIKQELSTYGDDENRLFCPHCEMDIQITVKVW